MRFVGRSSLWLYMHLVCLLKNKEFRHFRWLVWSYNLSHTSRSQALHKNIRWKNIMKKQEKIRNGKEEKVKITNESIYGLERVELSEFSKFKVRLCYLLPGQCPEFTILIFPGGDAFRNLKFKYLYWKRRRSGEDDVDRCMRRVCTYVHHWGVLRCRRRKGEDDAERVFFGSFYGSLRANGEYWREPPMQHQTCYRIHSTVTQSKFYKLRYSCSAGRNTRKLAFIYFGLFTSFSWVDRWRRTQLQAMINMVQNLHPFGNATGKR